MVTDRRIEVFEEESSIKQSNALVEAKYKLSPAEQKIVIAIASQINKNGDKFDTITVKARDLMRFCGFSETHYSWLISSVKQLRRRDIEIKYTDKITGKPRIRITGWISWADFHDGFIDFQIDERLNEDMLNLKKAYLSTPAKMLIQMTRDYSPRLYMLLKKQFDIKKGEKEVEGEKKWVAEDEIEISYLIEIFMLPKSYKKVFSHFRQKFIEPCLKEINEKSDIEVDHVFIKEGRAYKTIRFTITAKEEKPGKKEKKETPAISAATEELSPEKKKYAEKLHQIGLEPFALCEDFAKQKSVGALQYVCNKWNKSQNSNSPLGAGWVRNMLEGDGAEKEAARIEKEQNKYVLVPSETPKEKDETPYDNMGDDIKKSIEEFKQKNKMFLKG